MEECGNCRFFQPFPIEGGCEKLTDAEVVAVDQPACTDHEPGPKPLVDDLVAALRAIRGGVEAQFQYLETRGLNAHTICGAVMAHEDCELAGDCQTDARYTYPNRRLLLATVVDAALARYEREKEQADGEV